MQFSKNTQDLFKEAGWFSGRDMRIQFNAVARFNEFPLFLREFLYEYGNLEVPTATYDAERKCPTMDFTIIQKWPDTVQNHLNTARYYGEIMTFPIAYYPTDNAVLQCDAQGKIYIVGDWPCLMANDFKTGIEKIMMEDYSNTQVWDTDTKKWLDTDVWNATWGL